MTNDPQPSAKAGRQPGPAGALRGTCGTGRKTAALWVLAGSDARTGTRLLQERSGMIQAGTLWGSFGGTFCGGGSGPSFGAFGAVYCLQ